MAKGKTRFEQIPVEVVMQVAGRNTDSFSVPHIACAICGETVDLIRCKTDEHGQAVHDACYVEKVTLAGSL